MKICGTTNLDDAGLSVALGAQALGFIFAPSKRRVTVEQAAAITRALPESVVRVGVFTEPDVDAIAGAVHGAGLNAVQMHWKYAPEHVTDLRTALGDDVALWQVVGVPVQGAVEVGEWQRFGEQFAAAMASPALEVVLLDSVKDGQSGGLGEAFSWERTADTVRLALQGSRAAGDPAQKKKPALAVAGGLNAENVADPIRTLHPWAVDVVSGVEASPGRKSPQRLEAFMKAVRAASEEASPAAEAGNLG